MCYFKQGTISRMLFRGMLFALLAVCYPEYSRAVIAEDYQANRLITLSMKNISVADIIGQIRKTTRLFHLSFELGVPFPYPCQCGMGGNTIIGNQCVTNISNLNFSHF